MDKPAVKALFRRALSYALEADAEELEWCRGLSPDTFKTISIDAFLEAYCWVLYASGFKVKTVEAKFEQLRTAFHGFDLAKVAAMTSVDHVLTIIGNRKKADGFVRGAKSIQQKGFELFKERVMIGGMEELQCLPFIKEVTQKHLARNIGLADIYKDDVHLVRLAQHYAAGSVEELTSYLAGESGERQGVVDLVLWRYCADGQWNDGSQPLTSDSYQTSG
jgi:hypothetical protein